MIHAKQISANERNGKERKLQTNNTMKVDKKDDMKLESCE